MIVEGREGAITAMIKPVKFGEMARFPLESSHRTAAMGRIRTDNPDVCAAMLQPLRHRKADDDRMTSESDRIDLQRLASGIVYGGHRSLREVDAGLRRLDVFVRRTSCKSKFADKVAPGSRSH